MSEAADTLGDRRGDLDRDAASAEERAAQLEADREAAGAEVETHVSDLKSKTAEVDAATLAAESAERATRDAESARRDADAAVAETRVRIESHVARVRDDAGFDVAEESCRVGFSPPSELEDWGAVAQEVKELRGRLQRLGSVNLDAIGELEELESRHGDLASQLEDLHRSRRDLLKLIDDLTRESGERFTRTFEAVREHFGGLFRRLFGGGRADLVLQTEADDGAKIDPLEAGIEITARPPGKQPTRISQLSGGEKTMTCVALLLAVFESKPSPFCLLDEVDAALDEANNARFNAILEDFSRRSQFVVITHAKPTMRACDALYGVTMPTPGVSRRVAVRFEDVE